MIKFKLKTKNECPNIFDFNHRKKQISFFVEKREGHVLPNWCSLPNLVSSCENLAKNLKDTSCCTQMEGEKLGQ